MAKATGRLMRAYREFTNTGSLSTFSGDVRLSSNTVLIGNTQYQCILQTPYDGGTLAFTTNSAIILIAPEGASKIISTASPPSGH